jgi:hypothetical protein
MCKIWCFNCGKIRRGIAPAYDVDRCKDCNGTNIKWLSRREVKTIRTISSLKGKGIYI